MMPSRRVTQTESYTKTKQNLSPQKQRKNIKLIFH